MQLTSQVQGLCNYSVYIFVVFLPVNDVHAHLLQLNATAENICFLFCLSLLPAFLLFSHKLMRSLWMLRH